MITDKDLENLKFFTKNKEGNYSDIEDWLLISLNPARNEWEFCSCSCVDGSTEPIFKLDKYATMESFSELFFHVTKMELF